MGAARQGAGIGRAAAGLQAGSSSVRLQAALAIGTSPDPRLIGALIQRCGLEPDFYVRDMLTWALTRHSPARTVPALIGQLRSPHAQARSQALHTLSKIGDQRAWPAITRELLTDSDPEVARSAWRAAVVLVPEGQSPELARVLASQLGRGDRETQRSLSRALTALGEVVAPILDTAATDADPRVRGHVIATQQLLRDPAADFGVAVGQAKRVAALGPISQAAPSGDGGQGGYGAPPGSPEAGDAPHGTLAHPE